VLTSNCRVPLPIIWPTNVSGCPVRGGQARHSPSPDEILDVDEAAVLLPRPDLVFLRHDDAVLEFAGRLRRLVERAAGVQLQRLG